MSEPERYGWELPDDGRPAFDEIDAETEAAALRRAEADVAAGRVIPHEEVMRWLKTWGTAEEGPAPAAWFE